MTIYGIPIHMYGIHYPSPQTKHPLLLLEGLPLGSDAEDSCMNATDLGLCLLLSLNGDAVRVTISSLEKTALSQA